MSVRLLSTSEYLPEFVKSNEDFVNFPKNAIPLIKTKIGIEKRHHCASEEKLSDLAYKSGILALKNAELSPSDVGAVIVATSTPDRLFPATAVRVANMLGADNAFAFDMSAACSNGIFSCEVARSLIVSKTVKNALVINGDCLSKFLNPRDFSTYPYFGDGAGAVVLADSDDNSMPELLGAKLHSDGSGFEAVTIRGGGSEIPYQQRKNDSDFYLSMNGKAIYDFATTKVPQIIKNYMSEHSISVGDVERFILHQANINIINKIALDIGADTSDFQINISKLGNTGGASVLISLAEYFAQREAHSNNGYIILCGFGAGLCIGCSALKF